jgi:hypothetical protein
VLWDRAGKKAEIKENRKEKSIEEKRETREERSRGIE